MITRSFTGQNLSQLLYSVFIQCPPVLSVMKSVQCVKYNVIVINQYPDMTYIVYIIESDLKLKSNEWHQSIAEYAKLYVDYLLNKSVYNQFKAFYHGFHSVCASNALIVSITSALYNADQFNDWSQIFICILITFN